MSWNSLGRACRIQYSVVRERGEREREMRIAGGHRNNYTYKVLADCEGTGDEKARVARSIEHIEEARVVSM